jgi:endonuclease YncB( thermonuclease family)
MRSATQKTLLSILAFLLLSLRSFSEAADSQTAWVMRVVYGDTLFLTNSERLKLFGVETLEVHESKKVLRSRNIKKEY